MGSSKIYILFIIVQVMYAASAQEVVRRVPQGFLGMRGKKYYEIGENEYYKRKPQFFVGVKGKKNLDPVSDMDYKRAPMGFVGMRGKKESFYPDYMILPESYGPRRSGSLIGQIDYTTGDNLVGPEYPVLNEVINEYLDKLRENLEHEASTETSADLSDERINEVDKRANMHQFFGVRGKKSVVEKRPYDVSFRGKFIGVRGKKDLKNSGAQEMKYLPGPWPKRRSHAGFFGVRGKKWADDTLLDTDQSSEMAMPN